MADKYSSTVTVAKVGGNPKATAEDIDLTTYDKNTKITWTLVLKDGLTGYGFQNNATCGIDITPASQEFDDYNFKSATEINIKDKNEDGETYDYTITLDAPGGGTLETDPTITNRNQ